MSTLVIVLRVISLAAFAAPMLLSGRARRGDLAVHVERPAVDRTPLLANFAAFVLFLASLFVLSSDSSTSMALPLALSGCVVALSGAALVLRSRAELGSAWSLLPKADRDAGLVTTGPYRLVRHPIYLGLTLLATGNAIGFGNTVALLIVGSAVVPTFAWRARVEELELSRTFGDRFAAYRQRTSLIIPRVRDRGSGRKI